MSAQRAWKSPKGLAQGRPTALGNRATPESTACGASPADGAERLIEVPERTRQRTYLAYWGMADELHMQPKVWPVLVPSSQVFPAVSSVGDVVAESADHSVHQFSMTNDRFSPNIIACAVERSSVDADPCCTMAGVVIKKWYSSGVLGINPFLKVLDNLQIAPSPLSILLMLKMGRVGLPYYSGFCDPKHPEADWIFVGAGICFGERDVIFTMQALQSSEAWLAQLKRSFPHNIAKKLEIYEKDFSCAANFWSLWNRLWTVTAQSKRVHVVLYWTQNMSSGCSRTLRREYAPIVVSSGNLNTQPIAYDEVKYYFPSDEKVGMKLLVDRNAGTFMEGSAVMATAIPSVNSAGFACLARCYSSAEGALALYKTAAPMILKHAIYQGSRKTPVVTDSYRKFGELAAGQNFRLECSMTAPSVWAVAFFPSSRVRSRVPVLLNFKGFAGNDAPAQYEIHAFAPTSDWSCKTFFESTLDLMMSPKQLHLVKTAERRACVFWNMSGYMTFSSDQFVVIHLAHTWIKMHRHRELHGLVLDVRAVHAPDNQNNAVSKRDLTDMCSELETLTFEQVTQQLLVMRAAESSNITRRMAKLVTCTLFAMIEPDSGMSDDILDYLLDHRHVYFELLNQTVGSNVGGVYALLSKYASDSVAGITDEDVAAMFEECKKCSLLARLVIPVLLMHGKARICCELVPETALAELDDQSHRSLRVEEPGQTAAPDSAATDPAAAVTTAADSAPVTTTTTTSPAGAAAAVVSVPEAGEDLMEGVETAAAQPTSVPLLQESPGSATELDDSIDIVEESPKASITEVQVGLTASLDSLSQVAEKVSLGSVINRVPHSGLVNEDLFDCVYQTEQDPIGHIEAPVAPPPARISTDEAQGYGHTLAELDAIPKRAGEATVVGIRQLSHEHAEVTATRFAGDSDCAEVDALVGALSDPMVWDSDSRTAVVFGIQSVCTNIMRSLRLLFSAKVSEDFLTVASSVTFPRGSYFLYSFYSMFMFVLQNKSRHRHIVEYVKDILGRGDRDWRFDVIDAVAVAYILRYWAMFVELFNTVRQQETFRSCRMLSPALVHTLTVFCTGVFSAHGSKLFKTRDLCSWEPLSDLTPAGDFECAVDWTKWTDLNMEIAFADAVHYEAADVDSSSVGIATYFPADKVFCSRLAWTLVHSDSERSDATESLRGDDEQEHKKRQQSADHQEPARVASRKRQRAEVSADDVCPVSHRDMGARPSKRTKKAETVKADFKLSTTESGMYTIEPADVSSLIRVVQLWNPRQPFFHHQGVMWPVGYEVERTLDGKVYVCKIEVESHNEPRFVVSYKNDPDKKVVGLTPRAKNISDFVGQHVDCFGLYSKVVVEHLQQLYAVAKSKRKVCRPLKKVV